MTKPKTTTRKKKYYLVSLSMMFLIGVIIAILFALWHFYVGPADVSALLAPSYEDLSAEMISGLVYVILYLSFVFVVPVLLLGAAIFKILQLIINCLTRRSAAMPDLLSDADSTCDDI